MTATSPGKNGAGMKARHDVRTMDRGTLRDYFTWPNERVLTNAEYEEHFDATLRETIMAPGTRTLILRKPRSRYEYHVTIHGEGDRWDRWECPSCGRRSITPKGKVAGSSCDCPSRPALRAIDYYTGAPL